MLFYHFVVVKLWNAVLENREKLNLMNANYMC